MSTQPVEAPPSVRDGAAWNGFKLWAQAYRMELILFVVSTVVLASFSSQRFLRQSEAPHFVYQSMAWLEGHTDLDPQVLPNLEDWACVREVNGLKQRCEGQLRPDDKWYVSFPSFPAVVMLPFVAVNGYQFNDTSFGVLVGALAVALLYSLLRVLSEIEGSGRSEKENVALAAAFAFGSVFFYCAIRGEVWFSAEVMGVAFTCLYLRNAVGARRPLLAGLFFSMAALTRTPLIFSGVFFVVEVLCPRPGDRLADLKALSGGLNAAARRKLLSFTAGAAPLALAHALYNQLRFGSVAEFGHKFLYNNRVNRDIDTTGLFHPSYLPRNVDAALAMLPTFTWSPLNLGYNPWGLTLVLTLPMLLLVFVPASRPRLLWASLGAAGLVLLSSWGLPELPPPPGEFPIGHRHVLVWLALFGLVGTWLVLLSYDQAASRLKVPLLLTLAACAVPGLFYQNTGYAQFGFRFSLDWSPYVLMLLAVSGWSLRHRVVQGLLALGVVVNFWGAAAFRGYTELMRGW